MHYGNAAKWRETLLQYDDSDGQLSLLNIPEELGVDLNGTLIAQINQSVFALKQGEQVHCLRLDELETKNPIMTQLATLERRGYWFAIAADSGRYIFLTGGQSEAGELASALDTRANRWIDLPRLNHPREAHSSMVIGLHLYVIGGSGVGTIEGLNYVHGTAWVVLVEHS